MSKLSVAVTAALVGAFAGISGSVSIASDAGRPLTNEVYVLDLGGERFDPLSTAPPAKTRKASGEPDFHLVQFHGATQRSSLDALREQGVTIVQYVHPFTYIVWGTEESVSASARSSAVRWTGDFLPEYRVQPQERSYDGSIRPTMALISRHADQEALSAAMRAAGATLYSTTPLDTHLSVVQLDVPGNRYLSLAEIPGVYTVQDIPQDGGLRGEMSNQSVVGAYGTAPNYTIVPGYLTWLNNAGYDGNGVIAAIVDGGVRVSHQDLVGNVSPCVSAGGSPTSCTHSNNDHGTHVAGAVAGTGATGTLLNGFLRGQGTAPGASIVEQRYSSFMGGGPGGMIANGMLTIFRESALSNALLSNNSWGPASTPRGYDIPTQQVDMVTRDADPNTPGNQQILHVWSIMNGGGDAGGTCAPSSLGSPDEAKNLFAVGSTTLQNDAGAQLPGIFNVSGNSGHGNACDGRRVPHIVAPGCRTDSIGHTSDTAHVVAGFCGTSMASPVVTGAAAVFIEKYRAEQDGATPSPALIKAAFTPVAMNLQGRTNADGGVMGHRPDRFQGYGRLDLDAVINPPQPVFFHDEAEVFTASGESWTQELVAADPAQPIRIMLAWTDAKGHGLGGATPAWVNNLDLSVTADGDTYLGNVIGGDGWSATGGAADDRNNLEGVFLSPAQHNGVLSITVAATNIAGDALNPHTPGDPAQDFALVCYNCLAGPQGEANLALSMTDVPDPVQAGGTLTYVVQVGNFGPDEATGVTVELQLPEGLTFAVHRTLNVLNGAPLWECVSADATVTCTAPTAIANASFAPVLEVDVAVNGALAPGSVQTTATVAGNQNDPLSGNDSMVVETEIVGKPDGIFKHDFECSETAPGCAP